MRIAEIFSYKDGAVINCNTDVPQWCSLLFTFLPYLACVLVLQRQNVSVSLPCEVYSEPIVSKSKLPLAKITLITIWWADSCEDFFFVAIALHEVLCGVYGDANHRMSIKQIATLPFFKKTIFLSDYSIRTSSLYRGWPICWTPEHAPDATRRTNGKYLLGN